MDNWRKSPPLIGVGIGAVLAILLLLVGFWKTVLILILAGGGWYIGNFMEKNDLSIKQLFQIIKTMLSR
ncbi:DUF2273 domain-containing protein [Periweissella beninensis]|uniref:DUF2273 domain-containing protein n=1 Tax=Periweissella beninensis TaxID=504936 RepID=A0ABT0VI19_9LACO|nr:DUF2273 domain-containing protein [Periweissella beninensis]MBM7544496.1 putative membrane protein [Periweissella beninensis]MCM2437029.1 DUF2273 domain-containing protein [Periweissella beninensis]MCT4395794.1 DUF2273 domain-containing protein [Periweissella beninensis]